MVKRASKLMDNAIKQEESHGRDLSHRKPLIVIECHNLRFSQRSIKENFRDGSSLRGLINELAANPDQAYRIPPLRIFKSGAHYVSLDNRRLACLFECSWFLRQALKVRCMLYSPQFILTRMSKCQASKVRYYWSSAHRGAFVQVRGASARNASRVIRVFETNARSKAPKKDHDPNMVFKLVWLGAHGFQNARPKCSVKISKIFGQTFRPKFSANSFIYIVGHMLRQYKLSSQN